MRVLLIVSVLLFCIAGISYFSQKEKNRTAPAELSGTEQAIQAEIRTALREEHKEGKQKKQKTENEKRQKAGEDAQAETVKKTETYLAGMTLEEKVAQLFVIVPEALVDGVGCVTNAGEATEKAMQEIPVGGLIYMEKNLQSPQQVKTMLANTQTYSRERIGLPAFLCVDEEGGSVTRIAGKGSFDVPQLEDMASIGSSGNSKRAEQAGDMIGTYLAEYGFNVDFAPVADVLSNPDNTVVKKRSFGSDAGTVSKMCANVLSGLQKHGVYGTYKHFPGHGATTGDTHAGYACTQKTVEELKACELIPFQDAIDNGISFIMVGHISLPSVTGDEKPASLSEKIITGLLREDMGYDGIVITDALNMGAIVQQHSSSEAAVRTIQAGADLILMPADFHAAYQGVLDAVKNGELTEERIDTSMKRILKVKLQMENGDGYTDNITE